ncbi:MAG TPA: UpxY family transcription antiterminator [Chitinophagaceae bacterium]|nr:UpxY family transcription antiterminator [Chitinophagaceae bacterium]MCC6636073.1 UpxY family transcription antiterminator [Chitinophagaceae bacterium]HMZ45200.1 UpxY family transcription antiterminator [Chitinophagaceae bacterium]HNE93831.1 UpxY family transcription antiterminator [Chitinophagaceae bacterium]HNL82978.1 UpxY family transcription antiterminator [Chitinophagaceae bacterium]
MLSKEKKWYVIYTKPRWEKKVDTQLTRKNIVSWCPIQKIERQWTDRKKVIEDPLFKSYVFVYTNEEERVEILRTEGVLNFVKYLKEPAVIKDEEINLIKRFLAETDAKISIISDEGFKPDTLVKVSFGVFMNNVGKVVRGSKKKVYVQLQSLGQLMVVEFPSGYLTPL